MLLATARHVAVRRQDVVERRTHTEYTDFNFNHMFSFLFVVCRGDMADTAGQLQAGAAGS